MNGTNAPAAALSPGFARARQLSRLVAVLFALAFLMMLSCALSGVYFMFVPTTPAGISHGVGFMNGFDVRFGSLQGWSLAAAMAATELTFVPTVLALYHLCRLFLCFAKGEVFATRPIAHIRSAGQWQIISFFTGVGAIYLLVLAGIKGGVYDAIRRTPDLLVSLPSTAVHYENAIFVGVPIIIAAYVMEEARRIAADHAEIV
jgi:hypothetical protein